MVVRAIEAIGRAVGGVLSEVGAIGLFVLKTLLPNVSTQTVFRGVMPFFAIDCVRLAILIAVPWLSLYLPGLMR